MDGKALAAEIKLRLADEQDLREALARDQIETWFQPEVDLETGIVRVCEVVAVHDAGLIVDPLTARSRTPAARHKARCGTSRIRWCA